MGWRRPPRASLTSLRSGGSGTRPGGTMTPARGARCMGTARMPSQEARPGAEQMPRWSAGRRASSIARGSGAPSQGVPGAASPAAPGADRKVPAFSGAPPPRLCRAGSKARARNAPRECGRLLAQKSNERWRVVTRDDALNAPQARSTPLPPCEAWRGGVGGGGHIERFQVCGNSPTPNPSPPRATRVWGGKRTERAAQADHSTETVSAPKSTTV